MLHYNKRELTESFKLVQKSSETGAVFQGDLSHQSNPDNLTRTIISFFEFNVIQLREVCLMF